MNDYKFTPSYHISNIRNLKTKNLENEYNKLMQSLRIFYNEHNLANFEKNKHKVYK